MLRSRPLTDWSKVTHVPTALHLVGEWFTPFPSTPTQANCDDIEPASEASHGFAD